MLKFAKFIGANTDFSTAQSFIFPRILPEDQTEPVLGLVISGEGEDIFVHVRQKVLNLEDKFASSFERVTDKLHELGEIIKAQFNGVENLKFTLFCAKENVFYVFQFGNNIVNLWRQGKATPVISNPSLQEKVVSGFLQPGDRVLVLSAKPGEVNWSAEVIDQALTLPLEAIDDAEAIFAQDALKSEQREDLAGVKNIEPVAFVLIENVISTENAALAQDEPKADGVLESASIPNPKINFKLKLPKINLLLHLRSASRRLFGLVRGMNKKVLIGVGVLLLLTIISSSIWFYLQSKNTQKNQRLNNLITAIEKDLNEAGNLKDSDLKQAVEKISQAKARLTEAEGLDRENSKIKELKGRADEKETEVLKIYKNFNLDLFMSLDLIKQSFKTLRMSFSVGKILLLDRSDKSLVSIDTKLKTPNIIAGSQQLGDAKLASINGSHAFVYSSDKGIVHIDLDIGKVSIVSKPDESWGSIQDIFGFGSNIYALDTGNPPAGGMIWKYAPTLSGYSGKQEYLRSPANLGLGKRLIIDYSVWVLTSEPDIIKFTAGNKDFYALSGLNEPLENIDGLFVPEELDSVFILDKSKNRILVTKKNGEYLAQYINPEFAKVEDFFVDEEGKKIYLLIENKIYIVDLK